MPGDDARAELDEELAISGRRQSGWLVLVALLAVGAVAWALTRPAPTPKRVAASTTPVATRASSACRGVVHCTVRAGVPVGIDRLVRAYLPSGVRLRVHTAVLKDARTAETHVVGRDIEAFAGSVTVLIRVQRGGDGTEAITADPPGVGSLLLHHVNGGYLVRLQYLAPDTVPPSLDRLRALIRDPRLTEV